MKPFSWSSIIMLAAAVGLPYVGAAPCMNRLCVRDDQTSHEGHSTLVVRNAQPNNVLPPPPDDEAQQYYSDTKDDQQTMDGSPGKNPLVIKRYAPVTNPAMNQADQEIPVPDVSDSDSDSDS